MHHFFVEPSEIEGERICLRGQNFMHLKTVLRVRQGERVLISDGSGTDYECEVEEIGETELWLGICFREREHELPAELWLFQGLPKADKMELIIQKAVELGAHTVVPLETKNTVVRLEEKRAASKRLRWQAIAEAAAKQSKRSLIPEVLPPMSWKEALSRMPEFSVKLIPYENAEGIGKTLALLRELAERPAGERIAVFIGPEGGFSETEIREAEQAGLQSITLGRRILRTETAAICALSALMLALEGKER